MNEPRVERTQDEGETGGWEEEAATRALPKDDIRELIKLMTEGDVVELSLETAHTKLFIKREGSYVGRPSVAMPGTPVHLPEGMSFSAIPQPQINVPAAANQPAAENLLIITSPMVGTFYRAPSPKDRPFVEEDEIVEKGQIIGIIEAMKMMNEIPSEYGGKVRKILIETGKSVEFGTPLIALEPLEG